MNFIIVQLSPKRFAVAEGNRGEYTVCTKGITRDEAIQVERELLNREEREYSELTKQSLLEGT